MFLSHAFSIIHVFGWSLLLWQHTIREHKKISSSETTSDKWHRELTEEGLKSTIEL